LILSSNNQRAYVDQMRGNLHDLKDQLGVTAAVTQWNTRVTNANDVSTVVAEGLRRLQSGRPLPVHVEIPLDVLDEIAATNEVRLAPESAPRKPEPGVIAQAVEQIAHSRRVVLYCGGGATSAAVGEAILRRADRFGAMVVTSTMGKGSVPEDHPRVAGPTWHPGNEIDELVRSADCLVVFGSKLGYQATEGFRFPIPERLIRVDVDPVEMTRNAKPSCEILADALLGAEALDRALAERDLRLPGFPVEEIRNAVHAALSVAFGSSGSPT
jgi:acetolactate synthase-1/2/3 large subunit